MQKYKLLILGGGSGGITMASRMKKHFANGEIAIVDAADDHFYQPFWTLVGGGVGKKEETRKSMKSLIPNGVQWIKQSVSLIRANENLVELANGDKVAYENLIVATGVAYDFSKLSGLEGNLGKNGLHTIYTYDGCEKTFAALNQLKSGIALFTMPPPPMKCPGAPQKIMYMAEELFVRNKVRENIKIVWATAGGAMFGVPAFAAPLAEVVKRKDIKSLFMHKLVQIKADQKSAVFEVTKDGNVEQIEIKYDFLHIVPPQMPHQFLADSGLLHQEGAQKGWLKVDIHTLQHLDHKNIFGIGDVTGMPNSKTGAAVRACGPILEKNILNSINSRPLSEKYNGYASCPLITGYGKVILAEFGYDGKLMPSFPLDPTKERWIYWVLKRHLLPKLYWFGMLKGWL